MSNKRSKNRIIIAVASLTVVVVWNSFYSGHAVHTGSSSISDAFAAPHLPCWSLPGANETLVVLKTGSTELQDRLPVHFSTTLRCYPNYIIFSDYEEIMKGERIIDALESVSGDIVAQHQDFELYRSLKDQGRAMLEPMELSGSRSDPIQWVGKLDNPGWKLDKWKFLPMVNRTLHEYPDMKWYVFVEADTHILWASMLQYLAALDSSEPHYTGSQMYIGDVVFAHGGSGFMVSQPAMRLVVERYSIRKREIETFTDGHWAGDCVLGKVFKDAGVKFTDAWPIMQGDYPGIVPYARPDGRPVADTSKRVWCYPTVSYHHLSPDVIDDFWRFEQRWLATKNQDDVSFLRHKDIFELYILPRMSRELAEWDNESDDDEGKVDSMDACRAKCEARPACRQYSFSNSGRCNTRVDPRLGKSLTGVRSGWLQERMSQFKQDMAPCDGEGWMT